MSDRFIKVAEQELGNLPRPVQMDRGKQYVAGIVLLVITIVGWAINWSTVKVILHIWPPLLIPAEAAPDSWMMAPVVTE